VEVNMSDNTYKVTEIVGTSTTGVDDAIRNGVNKASQTLRNLDWFEVVGVRGHLVNGGIGHYQVTMKLGFRIDD
jgi:flavin-binding protein dodecin